MSGAGSLQNRSFVQSSGCGLHARSSPFSSPWTERHGIELSLLRHVSPIEWDNIVLYGEYVLNRRLVRRTRSQP